MDHSRGACGETITGEPSPAAGPVCAEPPLKIVFADDPADWLALWESWPLREVAAHPGYVKLFADDKSKPACALWHSAEGNVLYPFLLRDLTPEPYWSPELPARYDIITPYGYGGPFAWGSPDRSRLGQLFWAAFDAWARVNGLVSEFVRFNLLPQLQLDYPGERVFNRQNVIRTLDRSEDEIWTDLTSDTRRNVKLARRHGLALEVDATGQRLDEFVEVYRHTMDRRQATAGYYFPREFFAALCRDLPKQYVFFHAVHQGRIISSVLVLVTGENLYHFLSGTYQDAFDLRPNHWLNYEIIRWGIAQGKKRLILGGGHQENDTLLQYKLAFAPRGQVPFEVGSRIFRPELYDRLIDNRRRREGPGWTPKPGYFPAYRA